MAVLRKKGDGKQHTPIPTPALPLKGREKSEA